MNVSLLIEPEDLFSLLGHDGFFIFDCSFSLDDPSSGKRSFLKRHVPGARYVHLDDDLSGPIRPGITGRHPLPDPVVFLGRIASWGLDKNSRVVVYDDMGGGIAARMWWLLEACGLNHAAVLNGGFSKWESEEFPIESGNRRSENDTGSGLPGGNTVAETDYLLPVASTADVLGVIDDPDWTILDARASERYRGINEPIDPVAGHIPGAESLPWMENLDDQGWFLTPSMMRERFMPFVKDAAIDRTICYCGSGVTATHNILAMRLAGFEFPTLYPGSWSEWIVDPQRPVAQDPD